MTIKLLKAMASPKNYNLELTTDLRTTAGGK